MAVFTVGVTNANQSSGCGPGYFEAESAGEARAKFVAGEGLTEAWFATHGLTEWTIEQVT